MVEIIKASDIEKNISPEGTTFVNAFSETCGPCKLMAPSFEALSETSKVIKINANDSSNKEWVLKEKILGVPQTYVYQNGKFVKKIEGFVPKEVLDEYLV